MKKRVEAATITRAKTHQMEIPSRYEMTEDGKYIIMLSEFYDFDTPTNETVKVEKEVLIVLLESKRMEKRIEMQDYRHRVPFGFDENETAALEHIYEESADDVWFSRLDQAALYHAFYSLQPLQRRRLEQYYMDRLSLKAISKQENVSPKAIRFCMDRALAQLRKLLADLYE